MQTNKHTVVRIAAGMLLALLAVNAVGGGYYGLSGAEGVPLEWLENSPFHSYFIPSFFLMVVIGGSCATATFLVFRKSALSRRATIFCGLLLLSWILVQVAFIGYVSWLQPAVLAAGILLLLFSPRLPSTNFKSGK